MRSPLEARVLDANATAAGVSPDALMQKAGQGLAEAIVSTFPSAKGTDRKVVIVCGSGNNGGDGYVAAALLRSRCKVTVVALQPPATSVAQAAAKRYRGKVATGLRGLAAALPQADVIVDAMVGIGVHGSPRPPYDEAIAAIAAARRRGAQVVAVDVPSGMGFPRALRPDLTVTFHETKLGMTPATAGKVITVDIGIPARAHTHTGPGELLLIPPVGPQVRKGQRGTVLIIGGGPYHGAPLLAALGASRCGIDLVYAALPEQVVPIVAAHLPNLITTPLPGPHLSPGHVAAVRTAARKAGGVVLGPGLGRHAQTLEAVRDLAAALRTPMVLDADALFALSPLRRYPRILAGRPVVLTPHSGELQRLLGETVPPPSDEKGRVRAALRGARRSGAVVVLKGPVDVVATPQGEVRRNETGCPPMAVGGTGDTLAGIIGAMLAKGLSPFQAARVGVYLGGLAGQEAATRVGHSLQATDVCSALPTVLLRHLPWWAGGRD